VKIAAGFAVCLTITVVLGLLAATSMIRISKASKELSDVHVPESAIAQTIESATREIGYFMVAYSFNNDHSWWDRGQPALGVVTEQVKAVGDLAGRHNLPGLKQTAAELERLLQSYKATITDSRTAAEHLSAAREQCVAGATECSKHLDAYLKPAERRTG